MLKTLERWRQLLAENIALRNELSVPERNDAAQAAMERLLLLRLCADRGIAADGRAIDAGVSSWPAAAAIHGRIGQLFHCAWKRCGLEPSQFFGMLPSGLKVDDDPLREIIGELLDRGGELGILPPETLGQAYEQYLGKAVRFDDGGGAVIERAARKANGAYYTPASIVDYIVEHTIGDLLRSMSADEAAALTIVDPACGGGAFLLGVYRRLLDWRRDFYLADGAVKHSDKIFQDRRGTWRLRGGEKMRILRTNVFGVDIDPRAVETARLSLFIMALENDAQKSAPAGLTANIRCGNALIGRDFNRGQRGPSPDDIDDRRFNAFDWAAAFPAVAAAGGFDAVVGNPPWGQKAIDGDAAVKRYVQKRYPSAAGIYDLFRPFVERGICLLRPGGRFGMVLPDIVLLKNYQATRRYLLEQLSLDRIDWWGSAFDAAVIDAATIIGTKAAAGSGHRVAASVREAGRSFSQMIPQREFWSNPRLTFNLLITPEKRRLIARVQNNARLGDAFEIHEGVHSGNMRAEIFVAEKIDDTCRELYFGRGEIAPHRILWHGKYIRLAAMPSAKSRERYANLGNSQWHERTKVLVRRTGDRVLAAVDAAGRYASNNFFLVFPKSPCDLDLYGLCALLNSRFMTWYFRALEPRRGRVFAELKIKHLSTFPLPAHDSVCSELNAAGCHRVHVAEEAARAANEAARDGCLAAACDLDSRIDELVRQGYDLPMILDDELILKGD